MDSTPTAELTAAETQVESLGALLERVAGNLKALESSAVDEVKLREDVEGLATRLDQLSDKLGERLEFARSLAKILEVEGEGEKLLENLLADKVGVASTKKALFAARERLHETGQIIDKLNKVTSLRHLLERVQDAAARQVMSGALLQISVLLERILENRKGLEAILETLEEKGLAPDPAPEATPSGLSGVKEASSPGKDLGARFHTVNLGGSGVEEASSTETSPGGRLSAVNLAGVEKPSSPGKSPSRSGPKPAPNKEPQAAEVKGEPREPNPLSAPPRGKQEGKTAPAQAVREEAGKRVVMKGAKGQLPKASRTQPEAKGRHGDPSEHQPSQPSEAPRAEHPEKPLLPSGQFHRVRALLNRWAWWNPFVPSKLGDAIRTVAAKGDHALKVLIEALWGGRKRASLAAEHMPSLSPVPPRAEHPAPKEPPLPSAELHRVRALLNRWAWWNLFVPLKLGDAIRIVAAKEKHALRVHIEALWGGRKRVGLTAPHRGGAVDQMKFASLWDLPAAPPQEFRAAEDHQRVPGEEKVSDCPTCSGTGQKLCPKCGGKGQVGSCSCDKGCLICSTCEGACKVLNYQVCETLYTVQKLEKIDHDTDLPKELVIAAAGQDPFSETLTALKSKLLDPDLEKHCSELASKRVSFRFLREVLQPFYHISGSAAVGAPRRLVRSKLEFIKIPVLHLQCGFKDPTHPTGASHFEVWLCGTEQKLHFSGLPRAWTWRATGWLAAVAALGVGFGYGLARLLRELL